MRRFVYETNGKNGLVETFFLPQTPQEFANRVSRRVSSPKFMDGVKHFSTLVWALPEGAIHVDDVPRSSPARATYIQCGGSTGAMTIEIRVTHEDDSYEQYGGTRARDRPRGVGHGVLGQRRTRALHHPGPPRRGLHRRAGRPRLPGLHRARRPAPGRATAPNRRLTSRKSTNGAAPTTLRRITAP